MHDAHTGQRLPTLDVSSLVPCRGTENCFQDYNRFRDKHAGLPHLQLDPLYAIPEKLLDAILRHCRGWIRPYEEGFERDLTALCLKHHWVGTFRGNGVVHFISQVPNSPDFQDPAFACFATPALAKHYFDFALQMSDVVHKLRVAYLGWLLTSAQFQGEIYQLKERWNAVFSECEYVRYPAPLSRSPEEGSPHASSTMDRVPPGARDVTDLFRQDFDSFFDRWKLLRLATWDLPEPAGGNIGGPAEVSRLCHVDREPSFQMSSNLQLPARSPLRKALEDAQKANRASHLAEWSAICEQRHQQDLRYVRFQHIFYLHFYRNVVLASRYSDRFKDHVGELDRAFGEFLGIRPDTVTSRSTSRRRKGAAIPALTKGSTHGKAMHPAGGRGVETPRCRQARRCHPGQSRVGKSARWDALPEEERPTFPMGRAIRFAEVPAGAVPAGGKPLYQVQGDPVSAAPGQGFAVEVANVLRQFEGLLDFIAVLPAPPGSWPLAGTSPPASRRAAAPPRGGGGRGGGRR